MVAIGKMAKNVTKPQCFASTLALLLFIHFAMLVKAFVVPNTLCDYHRMRVLVSSNDVARSSSLKKLNFLFKRFNGKKQESSTRKGPSSIMQQPSPSPGNGNVLNSEEMQVNNNSSTNHQKIDGVTKLYNSTLLDKESESHDVTSATSSKKHSKNFFNYFKGRKRKHSSNARSISKESMPSSKNHTFQTNDEVNLKSNQSLNQNNVCDAETLNSSFTLIANQTKSNDVNVNTNNEPVEVNYKFKFFDSWKEQQKEGYKPFKLLKAANALKEMSLNGTMNIKSNQRSYNKTEIDYGSSSMWNNNMTKPMINKKDISIDNQPLTKTLKFFDSWKEQQQRVNQPLKMMKAGKNPNRTDKFITMADLEEILRSNGYVKREEPKASTTTKDGKKSTSVAFPQPTLVTYRDLIITTSISSSMIGMIVGGTILRNLWLGRRCILCQIIFFSFLRLTFIFCLL